MGRGQMSKIDTILLLVTSFFQAEITAGAVRQTRRFRLWIGDNNDKYLWETNLREQPFTIADTLLETY